MSLAKYILEEDIIDTNEIMESRLEKVCVVGKKYLDLANDEMILDRIMDFPFHISKDELRKIMNLYLNGDKNSSSHPLIIELF